MDVLRGLGLEMMMPPTFNIEKGIIEEPRLLDRTGKPVNLDEIDVFELAQLRGTNVSGLKELMNDRNQRIEEQKEHYRLTGQKHTKKDYEKLKAMSMTDVMALAKEDKRVQKFEDSSLEGIVKVEKKKNFKRRPKGEQSERDLEI